MLIRKFRTDRARYVYDTWTNEILEVDAGVFAALPGGVFGGKEEAPVDAAAFAAGRDAVAAARADGYLSEGYPQISNFPAECFDGIRDKLKLNGPDHLTINLTERCNFRCTYCSYSGAYEGMRAHSDARMSPEVLQQTLEWLLSHPRSAYSIGFYGGEPLMELEMIRWAVEWMRSHTEAPLTFRATTNGSLLTAETCRFLVDNDFHLTISIDGPAEVHDRYRVLKKGGGSFALAWKGIQTLRATDPRWFAKRVGYSLVAAPPSQLMAIHRFMEDNPDYFHDHRVAVAGVNPYPSELPQELSSASDREVLLKERDSLWAVFRDNLLGGRTSPTDLPLNFFKTDLFDVHLREMGRMDEVTSSNGQCEPGVGKCMVDVDGSIHMCERVGTTLPIGHVSTGFDMDKVLGFLAEYHEFLKDVCGTCWMVRLCNKCFIHFRIEDQLSRKRLHTFCKAQDRRWGWVMEQYIRMREDDPTVLDWVAEIEQDKGGS